MRRTSCFAAVLVLIISAATSHAQSSKPTSKETANPSQTQSVENETLNLENREISDNSKSPGWEIVQTLGALAIVIALIFGLRFVLKRFGGVTQMRGEVLNVIASRRIGPKQHLLAVRFGRRVVLLGSGTSGFRQLAEATDPDEVRELVGEVKDTDQPSRQGEAE